MRAIFHLIKGGAVVNKNLIFFFFSIILFACGAGNNSGNGQEIATDTIIRIDDTTSVPVINGAVTQGILYIRNYSDSDIHNITYNLNATKSQGIWSKLSAALSLKGVALKENANSFMLLNPEECNTVKAHGYCVLKFNTPSLTVGNKGFAMVSLKYLDHQGQSQSYLQIVNYQYVDISKIGLTFFNASLNTVATQGETRYIVSYLIAGGQIGNVYNNVNLVSDNDGQVAVKNGFVNGQQLAAGQLVPVEFIVKFNGSIATSTVVTPTYSDTNHSVYNNSKTETSDLFINIIPEKAAGNLTFGDASIVNLMQESTVTISIVNNGNQDITHGIGVSLPEGSVTNDCAGMVLLANAKNSCNITYTVTQYQPGYSPITYTLNGVDVGNGILVWVNDKPYPAIYTFPNVGYISTIRGATRNFAFTVNNVGNAPLDNVSFNYYSGGYADIVQTGTSCQQDPNHKGKYVLGPLSQCFVYMRYKAGTAFGTSSFYMMLAGNYNDKNYIFTSLSVNYIVTGIPLLQFTRPGAAEDVDLVVMANGSNYESYIFNVVNTGSAPAVLDGYTLDGTPTSHIPRIDNASLSNPCPQTGTLSENESCNIRVVYGPEPANLTANESGVVNLIINYTGGYPDQDRNITTSVKYLLRGNDSSIAPLIVSVTNFMGSGISTDPFNTTGANALDSLITLRYSNLSINYSMINFNIDTNNLPRGLVVAGGDCATGANVSTIPVNGSCDLILELDKADLATISASNTFNSAISYPPASWSNAAGFYEQAIVEDTNGNTSFYLNYTQALITPIITPNPLSAESAILFFATSNTVGYGTLNVNISGVNSWLESQPITSSDCQITGQDYSATCNLLGADPYIAYFMPSYLQSGDSAFIPLYFTLSNGEYAYIDATLKFIEYIQP